METFLSLICYFFIYVSQIYSVYLCLSRTKKQAICQERGRLLGRKSLSDLIEIHCRRNTVKLPEPLKRVVAIQKTGTV